MEEMNLNELAENLKRAKRHAHRLAKEYVRTAEKLPLTRPVSIQEKGYFYDHHHHWPDAAVTHYYETHGYWPDEDDLAYYIACKKWPTAAELDYFEAHGTWPEYKNRDF